MSSPKFLQGGGEMGTLIRNFDWSRTVLGAAADWPQSLKTAASIVLDSHFGMYIAWGPDFIQLYNDPYRPILGSTKHPAVGQPSRETFAESWHIIGPLFEQVRRGEAVGAEDWMLPLDRHGYLEECFFTFSYSPIRDESGNVGGVLVTVTETTGRVLGERRLRTLRQLASHAALAGTEEQAWANALEAFAANAEDLPFTCIYAIDRDAAAAHLVGCTKLGDGAPALPRNLKVGSGDKLWPFDEMLASGRPVQMSDLRQRIGDLHGTVWPEPVESAVLVPITRPSLTHPYGVLIVGISPRRAYDDAFRDFLLLAAEHLATAVANVRAYDDERRRAEALAELDRAKTTFFSNVSHEFRTPLTLMLGPTEEALASPEQVLAGEDLRTVHRNEQRLLKLVNTLLDFSRIEAGRAQAAFEATDLTEMTADLASAFRSAIARAGLNFVVDIERLSQPVYVDRQMWEKIVLNLLSNALKFSFEGSIGVALHDRGDHIELLVSDTGVGIEAHELPRLFERFHRVQGARARTHEGSGIGLALVNELVKMHSGKLEVSSRVGRGTSFTVSLPSGIAHLPAEHVLEPHASSPPAPLAGAAPYVEEAMRWLPGADETPRHSAAAQPMAETPPGAGCIVLVDDNADMRQYVSRLLADRWTVDSHGDGRSALKAIRAMRPVLVIADVMMPVLDGFGLLRELRGNAQTKDLPVILLSARAGEEARIDGLQAGADDYLVKPFSARELRARVEAQVLRATIHRVEEAHNRRLADVFSHAPVAIAILRGPQHVFEFVNAPYRRMIGDRDVVGKPLLEALPELTNQGIKELLDGVYASGEPFIADSLRAAIHRGPQGTPQDGYFKLVYQPMPDDSGRIDGIAVVAVEVTELANARREAESANLAKDEFIAMLSHELRNPLHPILTSLELMRLRGLEGAERERSIIGRQVRHLVTLVDDLLDVSRITRGKIDLKMEVIELAEVVAKAVEMASPLLEERRHMLALRVPRHGLSVRGEPARLAQVVSNLLTNAAKYTEAGGHIEIDGDRDGELVRLVVRDNGQGIAGDMLPLIFDLFTQARQTSDRSHGGLGLGLAIVRSLVGLHGGSVQVHSDGPGRGSVFTVHLPRIPMPDVSPADELSASVSPGEPAANGVPVLIVDDNQDGAEMIAELLGALGHPTRVAYDGPSALKILTEFVPAVALIDIGLPVMDGYELARRLRQIDQLRGTHLIAITGYGQARDREAALQAGFDAHLVKPVDLNELTRLLQVPPNRATGPG